MSVQFNTLKISTSKIPFYLITGFLGSGKTTFIKQLIQQYAGKERLAVVQNEFAPSSVDGYEMKQTGQSFELLEVNNGSVFCVCLLDSFKESLRNFIDQYKPSAILMEASGLSDPIAIAELFEAPELKDLIYLENVWCVIDALGFLEKSTMLTRMIHQVMVADKVLINKEDLAPEKIPSIIEKIRELNPFAEISTTQYCSIDLENALKFSGSEALAYKRAGEHESMESCGRPAINSGVLKTTQKISRANLESFVNFWAASVERLKGHVLLKEGNSVSVSVVSGKIETKAINYHNGPTELIAMGADFNLRKFHKSFKEHTQVQ